jgi:nucleoid DNA-binding protein
MVAITRLLLLAFTAAAAASTIVSRDDITVRNDITQKIGPQFTTLNNLINKFPASGDAGRESIHTAFTTLQTSLKGTVVDIRSFGSFSITSGVAVIADIQSRKPVFLATLNTAAAQAPSWAALEGGIKQMQKDLKSLAESFNTFMNAIIAAQPIILKAGGLALQTEMSGAFTTVIAAYNA